MSQFIGTTMPLGYAGTISRAFFDNTIEAKVNGGVKGYGVPVKLNTSTGKAEPCSATSDVVYGFAVREFVQGSVTDAILSQTVSVMRRGYLIVKVSGTPAIGGKVYLDANGGLSADANDGEDEPTSYTAIPNAVFVGTATDGLAEIAYNI
ncbi:MAG TPA: hypothetical protein IAC66_07515 [Candidatus Aphodousia gallistercoris]|nr:hypothetical protein [Candidatus Aphodousia gallistercoris]